MLGVGGARGRDLLLAETALRLKAIYWNVPDDLGLLRRIFAADSGDGAEELSQDVYDDGSPAGGNAVLRQKEKEARKDDVDGGSGLELEKIAKELGGNISGIDFKVAKSGVAKTEPSRGVENGKAAVAPGAHAVAAVRKGPR